MPYVRNYDTLNAIQGRIGAWADFDFTAIPKMR